MNRKRGRYVFVAHCASCGWPFYVTVGSLAPHYCSKPACVAAKVASRWSVS